MIRRDLRKLIVVASAAALFCACDWGWVRRQLGQKDDKAARSERKDTADGASSQPAPDPAAGTPAAAVELGAQPEHGLPPQEAQQVTAAPRAVVVRVPKGTVLPLALKTSLSTASNRRGDLVVAELREDVSVNGRVVLRAGSEVRGHVRVAVRPGRTKGRARLAVSFDRIAVRGVRHTLVASGIDITAKATKNRDAAMVGGGAGAGALVGAIAGGKKGAAVGVLVGAGAGTGAMLATRGHEVTLAAGHRVTVRLRQALTL